VAKLPVYTLAGPFTARENALVTVMLPLALFEASATLVAITEIPGGSVSICGAVYIPEESTVPHAAPVHPLAESAQFTERLGLPAELTVATKGREAPSSTSIDWGEMETEMSLVMVTAEDELAELSATLVAVTVTITGAGRIAGAVYTPPALIVPMDALPPGTPFTLQFTAVFVVLPTVAENVCAAPRRTDAEDGATLTVVLGGGGCDGPVPTTPPQPRRDAMKNNTGHS